MEVARRLETGMCHINDTTVHDEPQMPFGGVKDSGWGRFGGDAALDEFTELRWITVQQDPRGVPDLGDDMAWRDTPPFRADHVGSLLRPQALLKARDDFADGRIDAGELRGVEDDAIRDVVSMQEDVGLQSATDGEFRRASWHMDFIYALGGISQAPRTLTVKFHNADGDIEFTPAALHVDETITLERPIFADDFEYLKSQVTTNMPKLTIPSPSMVHYRGGAAAIDPPSTPTPTSSGAT